MTTVRLRVLLAFVCAVLAISVTLGLVAAMGETVWQDDGVSLCDETGDQIEPQIASDGAGGAIVSWEDEGDIYVQRVDGYGNDLWTADGVSLCTATNRQERPQIISTGAAGAFVTWQDERNLGTSGWDIYAQRVDHAGNALWTVDGVSLCAAATGQFDPQLVSDGSGGAIVSWSDERSGMYTDIYAQRVDASGNTLWHEDGVSLSVGTASKDYPQLVSDGAGGAIVTWQHGRDVYAQRVDGNGNTLWTANGVSLSVATGNQYEPQIVSDGSGGAIVTWEDSRYFGTSGWDIFAQRVDQNGNTLWLTDGITVCDYSGYQRAPKLVTDGMGGAVITWEDWREGGAGGDIYAQRLDANGIPVWQADGVGICMADYTQRKPQITSDGVGGAVVTWEHYSDTTNYDIYAQRVNQDGNTLWYTGGVSLCTAAEVQEWPRITTDGFWGAIVTWQDRRSDSHYDIYAQRVTGAADVNLPLVMRKYQ